MNIGSATKNDWQRVLELLDRMDLPIADLNGTHVVHFLVVHKGPALAGAVAVEPFAATGLLRSLVVDPGFRREGVGRILVQAAETRARESELTSLILLTMTAVPFFEKLGYERINRSEAPREVHGSEEFSRLCPSSAVCMRKALA